MLPLAIYVHLNEYYISYRVLIFCALFLSMVRNNMIATIVIKNITLVQTLIIVQEEMDVSLLSDVPVQ